MQAMPKPTSSVGSGLLPPVRGSGPVGIVVVGTGGSTWLMVVVVAGSVVVGTGGSTTTLVVVVLSPGGAVVEVTVVVVVLSPGGTVVVVVEVVVVSPV